MPGLKPRVTLASVGGGLVGGLIGAAVMSAGHALIINTIAGDRASLQATPEQLKEPASRPDVLLTQLDQIADVIG